MLRKYFVIIYCIILYSTSCSQEGVNDSTLRKYKKEAIDLNNQASRLLIEENTDTTLIMNLYKKAINEDSSYYVAHVNLATLLCEQNVQEAIDIIDKALKYSPNVVELYMYHGFLYEKVGNFEKAKLSYNDALEKCEKQLLKLPDNSSIVLAKINAYFFLYDKESALRELEKYSYLNEYSSFKEIFLELNREEFISSFCK